MNETIEPMAQPAPVSDSKMLMKVSDLLKKTLNLYKAHFQTLIIVALITTVGGFIFSAYSLDSGRNNVNPLIVFIIFIVYFITLIWGLAATIRIITDQDQKTSIGQAFSGAKKYIWPLFWTVFLGSIALIIGTILLVIPGIIVWVWVSIVMFIVMLENQSGVNALNAAKDLVKGYWWAVFGRLLIMVLITVVFSGIVGAITTGIFGIGVLGILIQYIVTALIIPFSTIYQYKVYKELRRVKGGESAPITEMPATQPA